MTKKDSKIKSMLATCKQRKGKKSGGVFPTFPTTHFWGSGS